MRVLGATKWQLSKVFLVTFLTVIPAIVLSVIATRLTELEMSHFLQEQVKENEPIVIENSDIIWKPIFYVGVVIPVVGLFVQLRKALTEMDLRRLIVPIWLRSSRERYYDKVQVTIKKLEKYGLDMWGCLISLALILNGYLAFYYIPKLLISNKIEEFSYAANFVFFLMLSGFAMIFNLV